MTARNTPSGPGPSTALHYMASLMSAEFEKVRQESGVSQSRLEILNNKKYFRLVFGNTSPGN